MFVTVPTRKKTVFTPNNYHPSIKPIQTNCRVQKKNQQQQTTKTILIRKTRNKVFINSKWDFHKTSSWELAREFLDL